MFAFRLLTCSRILLEKLIVIQLAKFSSVYETRRFIIVFQEPVTGPYPEPDETNAHPHALFM
jgi:hypothetical protein